MKQKTVLISGAGVAGLTLAYWLKRFGFSPTLVEKHSTLRTGGYKVDLRGVGLEVLKRMGVYPVIFESRTRIRDAKILDQRGCQVSSMSADLCGTRIAGADLEIMRGTLCQILRDALGEVECIFGDSIQQLIEREDGIEVKFEKSPPRTFDQVVGADGLHSTVRNLVFGEEANFLKELGVYVAVFSFPNFLNLTDCEIEQHFLRKFVNLYRDRKQTTATAAFAFSSSKRAPSRCSNEQQQFLREAFADTEWEMLPRIFAAMKESSDFYFDVMAQIHMPHWSKGRVALIGDAAYSATPMSGQGTSMAIVGAYVLAGEMFGSPDCSQAAFSRYEELMRPFIKMNQDLARLSARIMRDSFYSNWVYRLAALLPGKVVEYFKKLALKRTTKAANALNLKDYYEKSC